MKILQETLKYMRKNFVFIFCFTILPACFIGVFLHPFPIINFLVDYPNIVINNFGDILKKLFSLNWVTFLNLILSIIITVTVFSAFLGNIENHFKSGKLNVSSTANFINNSFLIVLVYICIFLIAYLIFKFLFALLVFILHILFGKLTMMATIPLYLVVIAASLLLLYFAGYLFCHMILALPDTNICGYSVRTSFSDANDLLNKKFMQTLFYVVLPFVIILPLIILGNVFNFLPLARVLSLIILFMYYSVLSYTCYFDYSQLSRYDNIKRYYY